MIKNEKSEYKYIFVDKSNNVFLMMPFVRGYSIGTDNTCKTLLELRHFFNGGALSSIRQMLEDIKKDDKNNPYHMSSFAKKRQQRIEQLNSYQSVLVQISESEVMTEFGGDFPELPAAFNDYFRAEGATTLQSMVLRPLNMDSMLRAPNVQFELNRNYVTEGSTGISQLVLQADFPSPPELLETLKSDTKIEAKKIVEAGSDGRNETISKFFIDQLNNSSIPAFDGVKGHIKSEDLSNNLSEVLMGEYDSDDIDDLTDTMIQSLGIEAGSGDYGPMQYAHLQSSLSGQVSISGRNEKLSIVVQFFLATINLEFKAHNITDRDWGKIIDGPEDCYRREIVKILTDQFDTALKGDLEGKILDYIMDNGEVFGLDVDLLKAYFAGDARAKLLEKYESMWDVIKGTDHFDDFVTINPEIENSFWCNYNGTIATPFANFALCIMDSLDSRLEEIFKENSDAFLALKLADREIPGLLRASNLQSANVSARAKFSPDYCADLFIKDLQSWKLSTPYKGDEHLESILRSARLDDIPQVIKLVSKGFLAGCWREETDILFGDYTQYSFFEQRDITKFFQVINKKCFLNLVAQDQAKDEIIDNLLEIIVVRLNLKIPQLREEDFDLLCCLASLLGVDQVCERLLDLSKKRQKSDLFNEIERSIKSDLVQDNYNNNINDYRLFSELVSDPNNSDLDLCTMVWRLSKEKLIASIAQDNNEENIIISLIKQNDKLIHKELIITLEEKFPDKKIRVRPILEQAANQSSDVFISLTKILLPRVEPGEDPSLCTNLLHWIIENSVEGLIKGLPGVIELFKHEQMVSEFKGYSPEEQQDLARLLYHQEELKIPIQMAKVLIESEIHLEFSVTREIYFSGDEKSQWVSFLDHTLANLPDCSIQTKMFFFKEFTSLGEDIDLSNLSCKNILIAASIDYVDSKEGGVGIWWRGVRSFGVDEMLKQLNLVCKTREIDKNYFVEIMSFDDTYDSAAKFASTHTFSDPEILYKAIRRNNYSFVKALWRGDELREKFLNASYNRVDLLSNLVKMDDLDLVRDALKEKTYLDELHNEYNRIRLFLDAATQSDEMMVYFVQSFPMPDEPVSGVHISITLIDRYIDSIYYFHDNHHKKSGEGIYALFRHEKTFNEFKNLDRWERKDLCVKLIRREIDLPEQLAHHCISNRIDLGCPITGHIHFMGDTKENWVAHINQMATRMEYQHDGRNILICLRELLTCDALEIDTRKSSKEFIKDFIRNTNWDPDVWSGILRDKWTKDYMLRSLNGIVKMMVSRMLQADVNDNMLDVLRMTRDIITPQDNEIYNKSAAEVVHSLGTVLKEDSLIADAQFMRSSEGPRKNC
tara:strand:- start:7069 stop:11076 length:4008 start_codon:yes stop_codon:yes gene_type:complete